MADDRLELEELRRLDELETKARPSLLQVAGSAVGRGGINLLNTPMAVADLVGHALVPPGLREKVPHIPNYPMKAAEAVGLVDPAKKPQTPTQRVVDTAIQAGTQAGMLTGPAGALVGGISGGLAQITKELTGSDLAAIAVGVLTPFAFASRTPIVQNQVGKSTLKEARDLGFVVQPSSIKPTFTTNRLESVAGKASVAQEASLRNAEVADRLTTKALGVPHGTPLTMQTLEDVRRTNSQSFRELASVSDDASTALNELRQVRSEATGLFRFYDRSADPKALKEAQQLTRKAEQLETSLEQMAQAAGRPELVDQMRAGRTMIARTYDVERALNLGDGHVSLSTLGRMMDQGRPLTGELKVMGKFAQAFPRVARDASGVPPPSASGVDAASSAVLATIGYGAAGGPAGLVAGALPLLRTPARNLVLSQKYQSSLLREPSSYLKTAAVRGAIVGKSLVDYHDEVLKK